MKKAWSGRFDRAEDALMERFNASLPVDRRLFEQDIEGSLAHVKGLKRAKLVSAAEAKKIARGLLVVREELRSGRFDFDPALEDIHMAVETRLRALIGPVAGKLHTARSRNDQVALDSRLFARSAARAVMDKILSLQKVLVGLAARHRKTVLPGYTHLQRAQPVLLAHHFLAYFEMLGRDRSRFSDNLKRLDESPLGAGALAGTPLPVDRDFTASELGFSGPTRNSLDTVSDRDFMLDFLSAAAILMMHLSRFCEELILWSSQEFGFVALPAEFCTGSSMMPQKVNPDAPELIRGKTGRVYGHLVALLTVMKGLPLAYNKDMQEDKTPLFDAFDTVSDCLDVLAKMLPDAKFDAGRMLKATRDGFLLATDLADYLARKGLPFREAHEVVGGLVRECVARGCALEDLDLTFLRRRSKFFASDVKRILSMSNSVDSRRTVGGTASSRVVKEIARAARRLR